MSTLDFSEIAKLNERYNKDPKSRIFVQLADAYRKNNMVEEALDVLHKGLEIHPRYPLAHLILGKCYMNKRMFPQARDAFKKTLELDPQNIVAFRMLAQVCEALRDETGQIEAYKGILALDPFDNQAKEKLDHLESMQKKEPLYTMAMGEEYEKQGNLKEALKIYEHLLFTDPTDIILQNKIKELKEKTGSRTVQPKVEKIEGLQGVEQFFKPQSVEPEKPPEPAPQKDEEIRSLDEFLVETKPAPETLAPSSAEPREEVKEEVKEEVEEKLDTLHSFKEKETATAELKTREEEIAIEPTHSVIESEAAEKPQPEIEPVLESQPVEEKPIKEPEAITEKPESVTGQPIEEPKPESVTEQQPIEAPKVESVTEQPIEAPKPESVTEQPVEEPKAEPITEQQPIEEPKREPATEQPIEEPKREPATEQPVEEPKPEPIAEQPTEEPKVESVTEQPIEEPKPEPITEQPIEKPKAESAPEKPAEEKSAPEPEKKEGPTKMKEDDFKSFQDWLSGLLK